MVSFTLKNLKELMKYNYTKSYLEKGLSFKYSGWFKDRKEYRECTSILWLKNNGMRIYDEISNERTAVLIFLN